MRLNPFNLFILWLSFAVSNAVAVVGQDDSDTHQYTKLSGTVTDDTGAPIEGIRVDISTAAPKVGQGIFCPSCYLDCRKWTTTNQKGEFEIVDLDPSLKFRLVAAGPSHKALQTDLINPNLGPVSISLSRLPTDIDPSHTLSGVVKNKLGMPIEGALVEPYGAQTDKRRWWGRVDVDSTVTNNEGRFTMILPEDFLGINIRVFADGYCSFQSELLAPGLQSAPIQMEDGATVTGKLQYAGRPISNMSIAVVQADRNVQNGIFIAAVGDVTDKNGSFEFKNLLPNQKYAIFSVVGEANRTKTEYILTTKTFTAPLTGQSRESGIIIRFEAYIDFWKSGPCRWRRAFFQHKTRFWTRPCLGSYQYSSS